MSDKIDTRPSPEDVVAVNRDVGIALTDRDRVIRLTDFIGPDGERCHEDDAVCAVGFSEDAESEWWSINLVDFRAEQNQ